MSYWDQPHIDIPHDRWHAARHADIAGQESLSRPARIFRDLALLFPQFQAPGRAQLLKLHRHEVETGDDWHRPYGDVTLKKALRELKDKGYYGIEQTSLGKRAGRSKPAIEMAYARSFSNVPHRHLEALARLSDEQIREHHAASLDIWRRWEATKQIIPNNVVDLAERRARRTA